MQELADTLGVAPRTVVDWEDDAMFPTKQYIDRMHQLSEQGPTGVRRSRRRRSDGMSPLQALADPELWRLLRKLIAHTELRRAVDRLAAEYDDPA